MKDNVVDSAGILGFSISEDAILNHKPSRHFGSLCLIIVLVAKKQCLPARSPVPIAKIPSKHWATKASRFTSRQMGQSCVRLALTTKTIAATIPSAPLLKTALCMWMFEFLRTPFRISLAFLPRRGIF